jgi:hypothetical protein
MRREYKTTVSSLLLKLSILSLIIQSDRNLVAEALSIPTLRVRSNPLGINYDPAPPPDKGPPLSAGSLRDPAYLPAQVGAIIGAYILALVVIGVALLTVGRRLRLESKVAKVQREVEMTESPVVQPYPFPVSPRSGNTQTNFSWPSPDKAYPNPYVFPPTSPRSVTTFRSAVDLQILAADKARMDKGLEDIYGHVMAHEEAKMAGKPPPEVPLPQNHFPMQQLPASRTLTKERSKPSTINIDKPQKTSSRASSMLSAVMSPRKLKGLKGRHISSPIATPMSQNFPRDYASDEEPLSPISYNPPPPPPIPKDQVPYQHHSRNTSAATSNDPSPVSPGASIAERIESSYPPTRLPYTQHQPNPSQTSVGSSKISLGLPANPKAQRAGLPPISTSLSRQGTPATGAATTTAGASAISVVPPPSGISTNTSTRTLPFRAFDPPPSLGVAASLTSPTATSFAPQVKTTVLERSAPSNLLSPGMRTPWTAGQVPYSPYMPQTPMTPFSPRLVTREERRMRKKLEARTPVVEMVRGEEEVWDSGY